MIILHRCQNTEVVAAYFPFADHKCLLLPFKWLKYPLMQHNFKQDHRPYPAGPSKMDWWLKSHPDSSILDPSSFLLQFTIYRNPNILDDFMHSMKFWLYFNFICLTWPDLTHMTHQAIGFLPPLLWKDEDSP